MNNGKRILVGTRKGLFDVKRVGGKWAIGKPAFIGDPVSMVLHDRRDGSLYAALNLGHFGVKFHRSTDGGENWEEMAAPKYAESEPAPPAAEGAPPAATGPSLKQIWALEAGGADQPGVLWAGTIPGGLFKSSDYGASWTLNEPLWDTPERKGWFGGGYDQPGIHSICVDPGDSQHVSVGVSSGGVWVTRDGGQNWMSRAKGMRAGYMPPDQQYNEAVQDPHRVVQCPSAPDKLWTQHHSGVFRSTDGAESWQEITNVQPSVFGFAVAVHPSEPDTAWFVPAVKDQCRIPVNGEMVVARTRDGGENFDVLRQGLPQENAYDLVYRHGLDIDSTGQSLAMGSTTGGLWVSENQGDQWECLSTSLPPIYCVRFAE